MAKKVNSAVPPQLQNGASVQTTEKKNASVRQLSCNGPVPVQPVAQNVQLTPIVQPIAFVPYSTQKQALLTFDDEYEEVVVNEDADMCAASEAPSEQYDSAKEMPIVKAKRKVSVAAIILIIIGLLTAAVFVVGKFVDVTAQYLAVAMSDAGFTSGYGAFEALINNIKGGVILNLTNLVPAAVALVAVFTALTIIGCLFAIMHRGACVFVKITTFFTLAFSLVSMVYQMVSDINNVGYGAYILAGLALIAVLVAYLSRNDKKVKKNKK